VFYFLSKFIWFFVSPINFIILVILIGVLLTYTRFFKAARIILICAVAVISVIGFTPIGFAMLATLEDDFVVPDNIEHVDGIIVLGGGIDWLVTNGRNQIEVVGAADRLTAVVALHAQFPAAKIVYTGRNRFNNGLPEPRAANVVSYFASMGVSSSQLLLEERSRNTDENVRFSKAMINPAEHENWLLVTSAFHMKRAKLLFDRASWNVVPYPVDFRSPGTNSPWPIFYDTVNYIDNVNVAVKEWLGIFVYKLLGKV